MDARSMMPYTPTDAGRVPKVKDFGIEGGWAVVFPVMACGAAGGLITLLWLIASAEMWWLKVIVGMSPLWLALLYVKVFVAGKPPHYRSDMWRTLKRYRPTWDNPPFRFLPFVPAFRARHVFFTRPQDAAAHPLITAARQFGERK